MPKLSQFFLDAFAEHKSCVQKLKNEMDWNCVEIFKSSSDYPSAIEEFRLFYEKNLESLQAKNLCDQAGMLFQAVRIAEESYLERSQQINFPEPTVISENEAVVPTDHQAAYSNENEFDQKEIDLFEKLMQLAKLPNLSVPFKASLNIKVQSAIEAENTFALLQALLEEINGHQSNNNVLKQSLSKALVIAYLLLNKPVLEGDSNYAELLGFLLQQVPVNEELVLDVIKLQVKIYLLHGEDLTSTYELLNGILGFSSNDDENVPQLSEAFFDRLKSLQSDIVSYQQEQIQFPYYKDLDGIQQIFDESSNELKSQQNLAFVERYVKNLLSFRSMDSQLPLETASHDSNQRTVSSQPLQTDDFSEEQTGLPEEQAKREFVSKLLKDARRITIQTSGQSLARHRESVCSP